MNKRRVISLTESDINRMVRNSVNTLLREFNEGMGDGGYFVCVDTDYDNGTVDFYIGDSNSAEQCSDSSEGNFIGPFDTYEEAEEVLENEMESYSMNGASVRRIDDASENENVFGESRLINRITESAKRMLRER